MLSIIADSRFIFLLRNAARRILSQVATDCPLCGGAALGGRLCAGCRDDTTLTMRDGRRRCVRCAQRWVPGKQICRNCAELNPAFTRVIAAFDYEPPFDSLIGRYKEEYRFGLSTTLAQLLADAVTRAGGVAGAPPLWSIRHAPAGISGVMPVLQAGTILVPIPASTVSLRRRGFNPAAELAASLGACLQLPVRRGVLRRLREGARQASRSRMARQTGVQGLFDCVGPVQGRSIGLVDDVMTTGNTVNAATHALLRAGASDVTVLVAARTPVRDRSADR